MKDSFGSDTYSTLTIRQRRLVGRLESRISKTRTKAVEEFLTLTRDEQTAVTSVLMQHLEGKVSKNLSWLCILTASILIAVTTGFALFRDTDIFISLLFCSAVLAVIPAVEFFTSIDPLKESLKILAAIVEDKRIVTAALAYPLEIGSKGAMYPDCHGIHDILLKRLLPYISEEDTIHWTDYQRNRLFRFLEKPFYDADLTVQVLRVIAFVGNKKALGRVQRLAEMKPEMTDRRSKNLPELVEKDFPKVKLAAQECLPLLKAHLEVIEQAGTLLRSSSMAGASSPENLLRPVENSLYETPPNELLRPGG
jgi:hypothetical protein